MRDWLQNRFDNFRLAKQIAVKWRDDEGVTLIELMAVVVILGIIAAVAIPVVTSAISQAKVNTTETNLGTLQQALERYAADHGQYPANLTALDQQTNSQGQSNQSGQQYGPYLSTPFPENDSWGHRIWYVPVPSNTDPTGYYLVSGDGKAVDSAASASGSTAAVPSFTTPYGGKSLLTSPSYIYAAGGVEGGAVIAASPTVTTTLPSNANPTTGSSVTYYDN